MNVRPGIRGRCAGWFLGAFLLSFGPALLVGCGREPFSMVPVSGRVTYSDGSPIPGEQIVIRFIPKQAVRSGNDVAPAATGDVDPKDGTFAGVTSHRHHDGVVSGPHKVVVMALKMGADGLMAATNAVPQRYQSAATAPLEWNAGQDRPPAVFKIEKGR